MLTAHIPSFPTCLFHPRSRHLLCLLDSPSTANLPCLGLQQQTRPEVSGLYVSYKVPSRSSLLPLCILSPREKCSQAKPPILPTSNTSLTWRECFTTSHKPYAVHHCVATTTHGKNRHKLPQTGSAMENRSHGHSFGTEISCTGSISGSGCTWILQTQHGLFGSEQK